MPERRVIRVRELEDFALDAAEMPALIAEVDRVRSGFGARLGGLTVSARGGRIDNLIGTIVTPRLEVEIGPKAASDDDWIASVLDLLDPGTVALADAEGLGGRDRGFVDAVSDIYSARLERAFAASGPITSLETREEKGTTLRGRLDATRYAVRAAFEPHLFPTTVRTLSLRNPYARTLAHVAHLLRARTLRPASRTRLARAVGRLGLTGPEVFRAPQNASGLRLPSQWKPYEGAWNLALLLLRTLRPFGSEGVGRGLTVAVEPWPLLEELLDRTLRDLATRISGVSATSGTRVRILRGTHGDARSRNAVPDGVLSLAGRPLLSLEAKYRNYDEPLRSEYYQALAAARAVRAPAAVLVYPNAFPTQGWDVEGHDGYPLKLWAVGLDMFRFRNHVGTAGRVDLLASIVSSSPSF